MVTSRPQPDNESKDVSAGSMPAVVDLRAFRERRRGTGAGDVRKGAPISVSWSIALHAFLLELSAAGLALGTIKLRETYLRRLARRHADKSPFELTPAELVEFMAGPEWGPETRKSARAAIVGFYRWAVECELIEDDPSRRLRPVRVPAGAPRPVPTETLRKAFQACRNDRERLMLMFAAYAGLRRGEIARVHARDFTADGLLVRGKGGRRRLVPVHPELALQVRRELELRAAGRHGSGWRFDSHVRADGFLFPGRSGAGVSADNVGRTLSRLLGPGWSGHTIRHRFASTAYAAERDLRAVQELLGHSKPETTARYVQTPTEAKQTAVLAVGIGA